MALVGNVLAWLVSLAAFALAALLTAYFVAMPSITWTLLTIACALVFAVLANPIGSRRIGLQGKWVRTTSLQFGVFALAVVSLIPVADQGRVFRAERNWTRYGSPPDRARLCYSSVANESASAQLLTRYHYAIIAASDNGDTSPFSVAKQFNRIRGEQLRLQTFGVDLRALQPLCEREFPTAADTHVASLPEDSGEAAMMCMFFASFFASAVEKVDADTATQYRGLAATLKPAVSRHFEAGG